MSKTYANGRSIVHQGDGQTNTCAAPDVCKTPSPGGPVPVPYVNVARDSDLSEGSKTVSIEGHPVALKGSYLSTSTGDEAGTAGGGLISSKTKGKMTWGTYSLDVRIEGKGVVRFLDVTQHNGNTFNTAFMQQGGTGLAYGDDSVDGNTTCPNCKEQKSEHRLLEKASALRPARKLLRELLRVSKQTGLAVFKESLDENGEPILRGYMIGVLVCRCGDGGRIYAAMSGTYYLKGFIEAVNRLCSQDDRWKMCKSLSGNSVITNPRGDEFPISDFEKKKIGKNRPGVCAGPQLIQAALRDGHVPASMSEIWFRPPMPKRLHQGGRTVSVEHLRNGRMVTKSFKHRESVPSCDTCKVVLTEMLCDVNKNEDC